MKKVKQVVKQNRGLGVMARGTRTNYEANNGAGDGIRTRELLLGKQTCYHCTTPACTHNYAVNGLSCQEICNRCLFFVVLFDYSGIEAL